MAQKDLRRVQAEALKIKAAEQRLRDAIVAAQQSGETIRDIAPYANLSPSRIHQILREAARGDR
jgi:hypothetical protein